jgi:hypothetical protein
MPHQTCSTKKSPTVSHEERVRHLAQAAADKLLTHPLGFADMVEHTGEEWQALAAYFAATDSAHLSGDDERETEGEARAFYEIGKAIGARTAGEAGAAASTARDIARTGVAAYFDDILTEVPGDHIPPQNLRELCNHLADVLARECKHDPPDPDAFQADAGYLIGLEVGLRLRNGGGAR